MTTATALNAPAPIIAALASVDDPEYPGVSIVDLGLVEVLSVSEGPAGLDVQVGLVPTFAGCPALAMIADDVRHAIDAVPEVVSCEVRWLAAPIWSTDRISAAAADVLSREFTVVLRRKDGGLRCPVCRSDAVEDRSAAGPTRCRSVAWCPSCRNVVEVLR